MDNQNKFDLWQDFITIKEDQDKEKFLNKHFNINIKLVNNTYNVIDVNSNEVLKTYYKSMIGSKNQLYGQIFEYITKVK